MAFLCAIDLEGVSPPAANLCILPCATHSDNGYQSRRLHSDNGYQIPPIPIVTVTYPTVTPDPTPTQEVSQHQLCVRQGQGDCYVNMNSLLLDGSITHTFANGRYVGVPEGYRPKLATSPARNPLATHPCPIFERRGNCFLHDSAAAGRTP
jgi:hypothetical protein